MAKLNLNFLNSANQVDQPNLIAILENFGKEITEYAKEYFSFIVTSSSSEGVLIDFSLYIVAPEIGYDYKVISVEILNVKDIRISFFTLLTKQVEHYDIDISEGTKTYEVKLSELLSTALFNKSLEFIVDQILLKRSANYEIITPTEIRNHISSNVTVRKDLTLYGIITGEIFLVSPSIFTVYGIVNGNINVPINSKLILYGMLNGDIINYGYSEIYGIVDGQLIDKGGKSKIVQGAVINEKKY